MAADIAVVGNRDSVEYFRVLGCDTYETKDGALAEGRFEEIMERRYRIILVTEEVFRAHREIIGRRTERTFPVVTIIPDVRGAARTKEGLAPGGVALEEIRAAVVRAIGQDISVR